MRNEPDFVVEPGEGWSEAKQAIDARLSRALAELGGCPSTPNEVLVI